MGIRDTINKNINKKKKANTIQKLYKHWLEEEPSSIEGILDDSSVAVQEKLTDQILEEYDFPNKQSLDIQDLKIIKSDNNYVWLSLPTRYFLRVVSVISLLLITLSVVTTVLIARSCS